LFLVSDELGLRLSALIALVRIEETAVAATVEVCAAGIAGIAAVDLHPAHKLELKSAVVTVER